MALEVKEIIVKVTVESKPQTPNINIQTIIHQTKHEILEECKLMIEKNHNINIER